MTVEWLLPSTDFYDFYSDHLLHPDHSETFQFLSIPEINRWNNTILDSVVLTPPESPKDQDYLVQPHWSPAHSEPSIWTSEASMENSTYPNVGPFGIDSPPTGPLFSEERVAFGEQQWIYPASAQCYQGMSPVLSETRRDPGYLSPLAVNLTPGAAPDCGSSEWTLPGTTDWPAVPDAASSFLPSPISGVDPCGISDSASFVESYETPNAGLGQARTCFYPHGETVDRSYQHRLPSLESRVAGFVSDSLDYLPETGPSVQIENHFQENNGTLPLGLGQEYCRAATPGLAFSSDGHMDAGFYTGTKSRNRGSHSRRSSLENNNLAGPSLFPAYELSSGSQRESRIPSYSMRVAMAGPRLAPREARSIPAEQVHSDLDGRFHPSFSPRLDRELPSTNLLSQRRSSLQEDVFTALATGNGEEKATNASTPRSHFYYQVGKDSDGHYRCPYASIERCNHKPTKLKCNYDKYIDSHVKPFRCTKNTCASLVFSSTACLLRHEREAHALHGHGDKPYLCEYPDCDRAVNGFPRRFNKVDHMKRVHGYGVTSGPDTAPTGDRKGARSNKVRKRKAAPAVAPVASSSRPARSRQTSTKPETIWMARHGSLDQSRTPYGTVDGSQDQVQPMQSPQDHFDVQAFQCEYATFDMYGREHGL